MKARSQKAEDVGHGVEAWWLAGEEFRGAHRALRVGGTARGAVGDLEALARSREEHRVVADNVAGARDRKADRPGLALARGAVAREHARLVELRSAGRGGPLGPLERVPRRVGGLERRRRIGADRDAARGRREVARVAADPGAARGLERRGERDAIGRRRRLEQRPAHAPAGSRDRDADHAHFVVGGADAAGGCAVGVAGATGALDGDDAGRTSPITATSLSSSKNTDSRVRSSALPPFTLLK